MKVYSYLKSLLFVLALVSIPVANAQTPDNAPPPPPHEGHGKGGKGGGPRQMIDQLSKKLNLSADQVKQVTDIVNSHDAALKALRDDTSLSNQDRRSKSQAIFKEIQTQVRAKLTADQQAIFDKMPPMGPPGRGKKKDGNPPPSN
jgi:periplasmic protein CpxP/Spy